MKGGIIKIRIMLWLILLFLILVLFWFALVPFGKISYSYNFKKRSDFISQLKPSSRLGGIKNGIQKVIGDPVYFNLRLPRNFQKAKLILKYRIPENFNTRLSVVEVGILADKTVWRYDLKPIENKIIDSLLLGGQWHSLRQGNTLLLEKEKKHNSLDEFLNNLPPRGQIAVYNYNLNSEYLLEDYQPSGKIQTISHNLRGAYQIYTYLKNEDLDFEFSFQDLNQNREADPVDVYLYYQNYLIKANHLDDDGISADFGQTSGLRRLSLKASSLPEGVYKIEVKAGDDIISKEIKTSQSKLSFLNRIWLAGEGNSSVVLYTDSTEIKAKVFDPKYLQTLKFAAEKIEIKEPYKQFRASSLSGSSTKELYLEKGGIILEGRGVFAFHKSNLFNPSLSQLSAADIKSGRVKYVLADYAPPKKTAGWQEGQAEFDLSKAYQEDGKYNFLISVPNLFADDKINDYIEIDRIKVELEGRSFGSWIRERL